MKYLANLEQLGQDSTIWIYGAGGAGSDLLGRIRDAKIRIHVKSFVDTYKSGTFRGLDVISFEELLNRHAPGKDTILVASTFEQDIAWMLDQAGISDYYVFRNIDRFILCKLATDRLPGNERLTILDVGAREWENDPRWLPVVSTGRAKFYTFEPGAGGEEKPAKEWFSNTVEAENFPVGLWGQKEKRTLYHTPNHPGASSLFPPDLNVFDRWKIQNRYGSLVEGHRLRSIEELDIEVDSLNSWQENYAIAAVDFAKFNAQGAELEILRGGDRILTDLLGMLVEVGFVENYTGRPLFSDIDPLLRQHRFHFFGFLWPLIVGRSDSPVSVRRLPKIGPIYGQFVEAHALYLRDPVDMDRRGENTDCFDKRTLLKLIVFAEVFDQIEYAFELLHWGRCVLSKMGDHGGALELADLETEAVARYEERFSDAASP